MSTEPDNTEPAHPESDDVESDNAEPGTAEPSAVQRDQNPPAGTRDTERLLLVISVVAITFVLGAIAGFGLAGSANHDRCHHEPWVESPMMPTPIPEPWVGEHPHIYEEPAWDDTWEPRTAGPSEPGTDETQVPHVGSTDRYSNPDREAPEWNDNNNGDGPTADDDTGSDTAPAGGPGPEAPADEPGR